MEKKTLLTTVFISMLLFLTVTGTHLINSVEAKLTPLPELPPRIYIRGDGSIEPSSAYIQRVGDTYTFTSDIKNAIEVQRDNVIIDGNGFSLTQIPVNTSGLTIRAGWYPGILLTNRRNVTVKNVRIHNCVSGIAFESSTNISITNNSITSIGKIAIFSASSSNCIISENDITNNHQGILIIDSTYFSILENKITGNSVGIQCYASTYSLKPDGSVTSGCAYIDIFGNYIAGNIPSGIVLSGSYIRIGHNTLANNYKGIYFGPSYHIMTYHNNFISNSQHVDIAVLDSGGGGTWIWDSGSKGNYWSDYLTKYPNATEKNNSEVGDTPYVIDANNVDNYPLMKEVLIKPPYVILEFPSPSPIPTPTPSPLSAPTPSPLPSPSEQPAKTAEPQPLKPEPFPTILVIASVAAAAVVGLGFLSYFKRSRTKNSRADNK